MNFACPCLSTPNNATAFLFSFFCFPSLIIYPGTRLFFSQQYSILPAVLCPSSHPARSITIPTAIIIIPTTWNSCFPTNSTIRRHTTTAFRPNSFPQVRPSDPLDDIAGGYTRTAPIAISCISTATPIPVSCCPASVPRRPTVTHDEYDTRRGRWSRPGIQRHRPGSLRHSHSSFAGGIRHTDGLLPPPTKQARKNLVRGPVPLPPHPTRYRY